MLEKNNFKMSEAVSFALQLGFFVAISVSFFLFLGIWTDKFFATTPLFLFVGLGIAIIAVVYKMRKLVLSSQGTGEKTIRNE